MNIAAGAPAQSPALELDTGSARLGPQKLLGIAEFRRLLFSKLAAQWGDGLFQAGLTSAVLFNPERQADPLAIAAGMAVLLVPYSIVGPFAGALLDRWDRRRVLVFANLLRGLMILVTAAVVGAGLDETLLYVPALLVTGISRFVGSGLSASTPHVVPARNLVEANAFAVTLGSVVALTGAACAVGLRELFGADNIGSAWTTSVALLGSVLAALVASGFARGCLGPDEVDEPAQPLVAVAHGLLDGARATLRVPSVAAGFVALLAHRAAFGVLLLITLLLLKYTFEDIGPLRAGAAGLAEFGMASGAGILVAGLVTPRLVARFGRRKLVCGALTIATVAQLGLILPMLLPTVLAGAFVITAAGQVIKLYVDAAVQRDIGDEARGRVFSLYDTLFNITQVTAVTITALVVPTTGQSRSLLVTAAGIFLVGIVGYLLVLHRRPAATGNSPR